MKDMCTIKEEKKIEGRKEVYCLFPKAFLQFINAWTFQCLILSHQFFGFTHDQIQVLDAVPRTTDFTKYNRLQ